MLFLTILFITLTVCTLIRGNLFHNSAISFGEARLKNAEGKLDDAELGMKVLKILAVAIPLFVLNVCYLIEAIYIDPIKYPTLGILTLVVVAIAKPKEKDDDLNTEEGRQKFKINLYSKKRRTFKGFVLNIIYLTYYLYMLHTIVFH